MPLNIQLLRAFMALRNQQDLLQAENERILWRNAGLALRIRNQLTPTPTPAPRSRRANVNRHRLAGHAKLYADYFAEDRTFDEGYFRRRFRMSRELFLRVVAGVTDHDRYFVQKRNCAGELGHSPLQKCTAALRQLAYGYAADVVDEYLRMGESTAIESLKRFCVAVVEVFGEEYLRHPSLEDLNRLLAVGESRGFPGMLGSLDCMHWTWKNCPSAWQGAYTGKEKEATIVLEAVASQDLWIWHAFFGMPGSHNDITILDHSPLFQNLCNGQAPAVSYMINNREYNMGYYLADGIYPTWATLVQTISEPQGPSKKHFAAMQEGARKDVERAFGVLQARFAMIKGPARLWSHQDLSAIMTTCIILHNMIVEDERDQELEPDQQRRYGLNAEPPAHAPDIGMDEIDAFIGRHQAMRNSDMHYQLRNDLIDHLWSRYGEKDA